MINFPRAILTLFLLASTAAVTHARPAIATAPSAHAFSLAKAPGGPCRAHRGSPPAQKAILKIGFIGDSITCGYNQLGTTITPGVNDVATLTVKKLSDPKGPSLADAGIPWKVYDKGVSGSCTTDWLPGAPDSLYASAKTAFVSAFGMPDPIRNPVWVFIMLGTNDVRSDRLLSAQTHKANLRAITTDLVAGGFNVVINHGPSFVAPTSFNGVTWDESSLRLLGSYLPLEKNISASFSKRAPGRVFMGDTSAFQFFETHPALFQEYGAYGGLHPNGTGGTEALAECWARAFRKILKTRHVGRG